MSRWLYAAAAVAALVAAVLYDRVELAPQPAEPPAAARTVTPRLSDPPTITADWYCPVGSASPDGYAPHRVVVSNVGQEPAVVALEVLTDAGAGPGLRFDLPALSTEVVDLAELTAATAAGAVVEIVGGEGVVGHEVTTAAGVAQGPCGTDTAGSWHFASGSTTRDATHVLAVMNPTLDDVVFSAEFQTAARTRKPSELEAAVVPAKSVRLVDVGAFVAREELIATRIESQGRLVVERLQAFDGALGPLGATLTLGVADPAATWWLPAGRLAPGADNRLVVSNPGTDLAEIDVYLDPLDPADRSSYGLVPLELAVGSQRSVELDLVDLATQIGLPLPYELGVRVVSANDVPVVVERWQLTPMIDRTLIGAGGTSARIIARAQDGDETEIPLEDAEPAESAVVFVQPTADRGSAISRGVEHTSTRWIVPWVSLRPDGGTVLVVAGDQARATVEARLLVGGTLLPPTRGVVDPDGRTIIALPAPADAGAVVITASEPIAVEAQVVEPGLRLDVVPAVPTLER